MLQQDFLENIVENLQFCSRPINSGNGSQSLDGKKGDKIGHYATVAETTDGYFIVENLPEGVRISNRFESFPKFRQCDQLDSYQLKQLRRNRITLEKLQSICEGEEKRYHWISNNCIHGQNRIRKFLGMEEVFNLSRLFIGGWLTFNFIYFLTKIWTLTFWGTNLFFFAWYWFK